MDLFYIASKIFTFFLAPSTWIFILFIWWLITKSRRLKKRLGVTIICVFLIFSNEALFTTIVNRWQPKPVDLSQKKYEAGIVLGGIVSFDKNSKGFFREAEDRFYQGCKLYNEGIIKKIIVSGGTVDENLPEEADFIKSEMISIGIKPEDIITETRSKTTKENAAFTKRIIDSIHLQPPFVLITSAQHIPRAKRLFTKAGINVVPFPCAYEVINKKLHPDDYVLPKIKVLENWKGFIKELMGSLVYKILDRG